MSNQMPPCRVKMPRRKVWLTPTAWVPCSNAVNIGERKTWTQSEFCTRQNSARSKSPQNVHVYIVLYQPMQETAKHRTKFRWPPLSDVRSVTKPTREIRWNVLGYPKLVNPSQPLMSRSSPYCEHIWRRYCCLITFLPIYTLVVKI